MRERVALVVLAALLPLGLGAGAIVAWLLVRRPAWRDVLAAGLLMCGAAALAAGTAHDAAGGRAAVLVVLLMSAMLAGVAREIRA